ncbi:helix-turn-helix transcriptional regulator [Pseudomonas plecoglossicida]|uniref:LuxR family transcriptional regulator n=1 Tax=Pseudomonas plecoglossicida TaxID=70775 RepID=A0AAD0R0N4_PSEDL|nr:helix-turn-helix transcriptional regulator [Pseudomonas plecoglossicida]AXM99095.1 LuxR family transcriptional regulator [Pseudomonas plecoglossicida]
MEALLRELPIHQGIARVIDALGKEDFWRALLDALCLLVPAENALVALMQPGQVPRLLLEVDSRIEAEQYDVNVDYCSGMYLLDPFYQKVCAGVSDGLHSLESLAPDQFHQSEYFQHFFRHVVGSDELQFMLNIEGGVVGLSLGSSQSFTLEEQGTLLCVRDWVIAAMRRHLQLTPANSPSTEIDNLALMLERFASRLSAREIETGKLVLRGFSSKAIAQQLSISPATVKVHRRNLYHKLNVSGHAELFALLLQSS